MPTGSSTSSSAGAADLLRLASSFRDADVARDAIAEKLGVRVESIRVFDGRDPRFFRPPTADAIGCATPCTSGVLEADNPFYDVFISCSEGSFTARTGASHSVTIDSGARQNVIFGGAGGGPGTSDIGWFVHTTGTFYDEPTGGRACAFDPADTAGEPDSIGLEQEWTVTPGAGVTLTLRQEVVAFGDTEESSGIRLTLGARNDATSVTAVNMGVRWQIDYQNGGDDGPLYSPVVCDPFGIGPELSTEHELTATEIDAQDFYRIQNNTGSPIFANFTSTAPIAGFPDTGRPDRLVFGRWPSLVGAGWSYAAVEGATGPDSDSATLNYYGYLPADGIVIGPDESFTRSVVIFTRGEDQDCGDFRSGTGRDASVTVCAGECVRVGADAIDNCGPATVTVIGIDPPTAPPCAGSPCDLSFSDPGTYVYTFQATDEAGNVTTATSTITVEDSGPPDLVVEEPFEECLWPPNHWYVCFDTADFIHVEAIDDCPGVRVVVVGCESNQPDEAPDPSDPGWNGDGSFENDCVWSPDGTTVCVRSERCGVGPTRAAAQEGRTYTITVVAEDSGGAATGPVVAGTIHVPHDQSPHERPCVDPTKVGLHPQDPFPWE
jgi:hypothetical protein